MKSCVHGLIVSSLLHCEYSKPQMEYLDRDYPLYTIRISAKKLWHRTTSTKKPSFCFWYFGIFIFILIHTSLIEWECFSLPKQNESLFLININLERSKHTMKEQQQVHFCSMVQIVNDPLHWSVNVWVHAKMQSILGASCLFTLQFSQKEDVEGGLKL